MNTYAFYLVPYYDNYLEQYYNIIQINTIPKGPLSNYIVKMSNPKKSMLNKDFYNNYNTSLQNCCVYVIKNIVNDSCNNSSNLLQFENIDSLVNFLIENNYSINKDLTKIMNNEKIYLNNQKRLIFYVNYNGN